MNNRTFLALAALMIGTASIAAIAQSRVVGVNAAIRNNVQIKTSSDGAFRKALLKERVSLGDDILTASGSVLQILLLDRTSFTVGANARIRIDRFVYDPARGASAVGASVAKGAFRFMSGKATRGSPGQSSVSTPVGSIGIRGTIFEGAVGADAVRIARGEASVGAAAANSDKALLLILRGPGAATQGDERAGAVDFVGEGNSGSVTLDRPGLALFVPGPGKKPIGPFLISDAGLEALHALLRTSPNRRGANTIQFEGSPVVDMIFECEGGFSDPVSNQSSSSSSSSGGGCSIAPSSPRPPSPTGP